MSRHIILCADDYALAPGVSAAIRELIAHGRLNATSVMTIFPEFEAEVKSLQAVKSPIPYLTGLHATLTGGFAPLVAAPITTSDGLFPMSSKLLPPMGFFRVDRHAVKTEIKAQIQKFKNAFGRLPDYVDGHQHVQLMPGVRTAFLTAVAEAAPKAWVRQCAPVTLSADLLGSSKSRFLGMLSRGFRKRARRLGLSYNPAFAGAYDYDRPKDFGKLFPRFLEGLPEGGVVMCHPGHLDKLLAARDALTDQREREYAFLMSDDFPRVLQRAGATLA
jgi:predicted glycoside hydrolase/deacetylase ChbG (UPF0249 family)